MKHGILISAVCVASLLLFGCADNKRMAALETTNRALQVEIQNLDLQIQSGAADKAKIQELEQANQVLQAEIQKLHLQAMNTKTVPVAKKSASASSKGKTVSKTSASRAGATAR